MPDSISVSLIGVGRTGSCVRELLEGKGYESVVFNSSHAPSPEELRHTDVGIAFVPGDVFEKMIPLLLESRLPLVCGSTGVDWPPDLDVRLRECGIPWIRGSNFATGMLLIREMLAALGKAREIFPQHSAKIEETHHVGKKDAPSGTALKWSQWSGLSPSIQSFRKGDVTGEHRFILESGDGEKIVLTHEASGRKLFASGALWAAEQLCSAPPEAGLHWFETFARERLFGTF